MEVFNLDIIPGKSAPVIHASQYDVGREFKANLFEGPAVYTLSGAETLAVYVRKPDGNMVTVAVTNTSDSYITFETTEQMTACDGASLCELRIQNGADVIGTANFILECEKSPDTGITSQTEINNLETLVDGFTALAVADQYDSANVIFDATPTSGHGNGYAVTSDGLYTAITPLTETTITITRGATMPGGFPVPTLQRFGKVCIVLYALQIPAGTYANTDILWNLSVAPKSHVRNTVQIGGNPVTLNINTSGEVYFQGAQTFSGAVWAFGQIVYITT